MPNTNFVIKKGELVNVNNIGVCYDPNILPNPEEWNPENLSSENLANRNAYSFKLLSHGPRN